MAIKIKLTERQQKLAAGEIDGDEPVDNAEALRDAGFDFVDSNDDEEGDGNDDDELRPSGEYIDDGVVDDGTDDRTNNDGGGDGASWIDDQVRSYATSYGLTDEDLATFDSLESLRRFGTLMDRRLAASPSVGANNDGSGKTGESQEPPEKKPSVLDRLKPLDRKRYEDANYGEHELELVDQLNGAIDAIREIFPGFMQQREQSAAQQKQQMLQEFHEALDGIDDKVYGRAYKDGKPVGKLSEAFESNRQAVLDAMERLSQGIAADAAKRGVQPQIPPVSVLAQRAAAIVMDTLEVPEQQGGKRVNTEQVAAQSRRRRPTGTGGTRHAGTVGSGAGKGKPMTEADEIRAIANNPDVASFFKKAQRENGVA